MSIDRRQFLLMAGGAALIGGTGALPLLPFGRPHQTRTLLRSQIVLPPRFAVPLPVPPVAQPTGRGASVDHYVLTMRAAEQEIIPGRAATVWDYDGAIPGPTFRVRRGNPVQVRFRNQLSVRVFARPRHARQHRRHRRPGRGVDPDHPQPL